MILILASLLSLFPQMLCYCLPVAAAAVAAAAACCGCCCCCCCYCVAVAVVAIAVVAAADSGTTTAGVTALLLCRTCWKADQQVLCHLMTTTDFSVAVQTRLKLSAVVQQILFYMDILNGK